MDIQALEYVVKFLAGGSIVVLVSYLAQKGNTILAGILLAAPIITLTSSFIVGNQTGRNALTATIKSDIIFLPLMFAFLFPLYFLLRKTSLDVNMSIILALVIWTIASLVFFQYRQWLGL